MTHPDKLFSFDLETTGLNINTDRIVSAAVVGEFLPNGGRKIYLNPGIPIPPDATKVHGITDEMVANQLPYAEGVPHPPHGFLGMEQRGTMVGHNIHGFDLPMLRMQERAVFGSSYTRFGNTVDTLKAFRSAFRGEPATLTAACAKLHIPLRGAHDAAADAWASLGVDRALSVAS